MDARARQCTPEHVNARQSFPVHARARQCTPEHARARQSTPIPTRARQSTPEHASARQSTSMHARASKSTPEHPSERQSTPVHSTARQCTPEHANSPVMCTSTEKLTYPKNVKVIRILKVLRNKSKKKRQRNVNFFILQTYDVTSHIHQSFIYCYCP
jgi:hypothetical protein